jgi:16S rRNA pseudouridine516 synthase
MPSDKRYPRLDQLLASLGYGSRREVDIFLKKKLITIEGIDKVKSDLRVDPNLIRFEGEPLDNPLGLLILMHKPVGHVCSHNDEEGKLVYDLLPARWRVRNPQVVSVGRLDKDTSGLLLLTDQHELVHALTSPKHHVAKIYEATVEKPLRPEMVDIFASGELMLNGESKPCLPAKLEIISEFQARVTLREGRYHQVRRMFAALGCHVVKLHRSQFGELMLSDLALGEFKLLPLNTKI